MTQSIEPTLEQELAALGFGHRAHPTRSGHAEGKRIVYRLSDGKEIGSLSAHEAWEWLHEKRRRP